MILTARLSSRARLGRGDLVKVEKTVADLVVLTVVTGLGGFCIAATNLAKMAGLEGCSVFVLAAVATLTEAAAGLDLDLGEAATLDLVEIFFLPRLFFQKLVLVGFFAL